MPGSVRGETETRDVAAVSPATSGTCVELARPSLDRHTEVSKPHRVGSAIGHTVDEGEDMDSDRVEGKTKQLEGEAQEGWGKLKDKARDVLDDVKDAVDGDDDKDEADEKRVG
jgi:uncharacterized protein YjbJ (UPF0337 family)